MMKIAIVEDKKEDVALLREQIEKYSRENIIAVEISIFEDGMSFVSNYCPDYDVVFFDIEMPYLNGLDAAKEIRAIDGSVTIIFVTNMAQYAIRGYDVEATGFIVKPVSYGALKPLLGKAEQNAAFRDTVKITIKDEGDLVILSPSDIYYVEAMGHMLVFHTKKGNYSTNRRLKNVEKQLEGRHFFMIKNCYLVNMRYISVVKKDSIIINDEELFISRRRKKEFMESFAFFLGEGIR